MTLKRSLVIVFDQEKSIGEIEATLNIVTNEEVIRMKYFNPITNSLVPEFTNQSNELLISSDSWGLEISLIIDYEIVNNKIGFSDCIEIQTWDYKTYELIIKYQIYDLLSSILLMKYSKQILSIVTFIDYDENCPSAEQIKIAVREGRLDKYKLLINVKQLYE